LSDTSTTATPLVSIIVPVAEWSARTATCLDSVLNAADLAPEPCELIVVLNGARVPAEWPPSGRSTPTIMVEHPRPLGAAGARLAGSRYAIGQFLAYTDADCRVPPQWVTAMRSASARTGLASSALAVIGSGVLADIEGKAIWYGPQGAHGGYRALLAQGSMMVDRDQWLPALTDPRNLADDIQLSIAYRVQGTAIADADVVVHTHVPMRIAGVLRRRKRHASGLGWLQARMSPHVWRAVGLPTPHDHMRSSWVSARSLPVPLRLLSIVLDAWFVLWWQLSLWRALRLPTRV
jgi:hypothetical protein